MKKRLILLLLTYSVAESKEPQHYPTSRSAASYIEATEARHFKNTVRQDFKKSTPKNTSMRKLPILACTASCGGSQELKGPQELRDLHTLKPLGSNGQDSKGSKEWQSQAGKELEEILSSKASGQSSKDQGTPLYVFISFSLHKNTLKALMKENHLLVLRGLKKDYRGVGSWKETFRFLLDLGHPQNIIIDPTLFKKYDISRVPTFVKGRRKVSGNISAKRALEIMERDS